MFSCSPVSLAGVRRDEHENGGGGEGSRDEGKLHEDDRNIGAIIKIV